MVALGGALHMEAQTVEVTIKACLQEMREHSEEAASMANAAESCLDAGKSKNKSRSHSMLSN